MPIAIKSFQVWNAGIGCMYACMYVCLKSHPLSCAVCFWFPGQAFTSHIVSFSCDTVIYHHFSFIAFMDSVTLLDYIYLQIDLKKNCQYIFLFPMKKKKPTADYEKNKFLFKINKSALTKLRYVGCILCSEFKPSGFGGLV